MANMHFKADLLPSTDLGYSLGSSDERWKIYGIMEDGLEIKGHIAGDSETTGHGLWSGGGYHNAYNNIILHGDATTGTSGIAFISDKGGTAINQPSDRAFIQWHAMGVTTYTAEGTAPTLATSGEANVLMIGVGNDATDQVRIQTPGRTGLLHQVASAGYVIPDTNNTTGTVGSGTQPVWVDGGVIKNTTYTLGKSVPSNAVFTDTNNAVTQTNQTGANDYRILLSGSANDTTATEGANKSTNLRFNPSTKVFSVGGDISATGDLTITGNANLNNETYAESITAGSLLVNGAANFVNIPTAPTPVVTSNDTSIATTAFVMNAFTANDAMVFKGVVNANSDLPANHKQGWTYRIGTAGTYANKVCEVGDIIICVTDGTAANNDHWAIIQNNIDGAVYKGANAFTDAHVIVADSTAGKVKDSGKTITTTAPSSSAADTTIPTSKAVWSAITSASGYGKTGTVTSITAGAGLNTTSNDTATDGGSITSSGTLYLTKSGVTAGSYGPSAAVTGNDGTTMNVPYITVDKYGRVTSISNKTYTAKNTTYTFTAGTSILAWNSEVTLATVGGLAIKAKLPANPNTNTDTLVKQTVKTDNVNYKLLGTTSASPSSGTAMEATYSANIYANPSTGAVSAVRHTLNVGGADKAYMAFNSTTNAIDFIFV